MIVNLETQCYEKNWEYVIKTNKILNLVENSSFNFNKITLFINNVNKHDLVSKEADKLIKNKIIDDFIIVKDYAEEALDFFNIDINYFSGGYYCSISEIVSIYLTKSDYLVHFSADSDLLNKYNWIDDSIKEMDKNSNIIVSCPSWTNNINKIREEQSSEDELFHYCQGFSDQAFLIKTSEFKNKIYNEDNLISDSYYPKQWGKSFERRIGAYIKNNNKIRIVSKNSFYEHKNL